MNYLILAVLCVLGSVAKASPQNFIVNGVESDQVLPYHVHLLISRTPAAPITHFGSGTLISQTRVLTVAQNIVGFTNWRAGVGSVTRTNLIWYNSVLGLVHPNYNARYLINNIGIIQIQPVVLSPNIQPIVLPGLNWNITFVGLDLRVSGFGLINNGNAADTLKIATKLMISQEDCAAAYPHIVKHGHISDFFCAVDIEGGSNICGGDQGSPVTILNQPIVFGLSSFIRNGNNCTDSRPAAYVRITSYIDWIQSIPQGITNL